MSTLVRLVSPWPQHCPNVSTVSCNLPDNRKRSDFKGIVTIGKPSEPDANWICGTDLVWPVLSLDGVEIIPDVEGDYPYVCRHQIEAGD